MMNLPLNLPVLAPTNTAGVGLLGNIQEAVSNCSPEVIEQVLKQQPESVNQKGWHGLSPLHKAALRGESAVVKLLLDYNADPNARNEFQETPLMFACKRGNPRVIEVLVERGADIGAVDKQGRGVIHHAAHGGSVYCMHYLHEVCGVPYDWNDNMKQTALQIVSMHGYIEALKYLLKNDRVNVHHVDVNGNNALHIAGKQGHSWVTWLLLQIGKVKMVHVQNNEGLTPLDLASKDKDIKHKETADLMRYYSRFPNHNYQPEGPSIGWYWHMFMPSIFYIASVLLAKYLGEYVYGEGVVILICLVSLVCTVLKHGHRIEHLSKWPNPIYAGCFAGGMFGSVVCFYAHIMFYIPEHFLLIGILMLSTPIILYMYWQLLRADPGAVWSSAMKEDGRYYTIKDVCYGNMKVEDFCISCEFVQPNRQVDRIKHCKLCETCLYAMDHHCLFLLKCVARNNHRIFVIFILMVVFNIFLFLWSIVMYFNVLYPSEKWTDIVKLAFTENAWVFSIGILNFLSILWGCFLVKSQLVLVSEGFTTVFQPMFRKGSGLSSTEKLLNVVYFLQGKERYAKDPLYDV